MTADLFPLAHAWAWALAVCALAALLEGLCSGTDVKQHFAGLDQPKGSPSLWVWSLIGVGYYVLFFLVLRSLFSRPAVPLWSWLAIGMVALVLVANAVWNAVFFRVADLRFTFRFSVAYAMIAGALALVLVRIEHPLTPWYLLYVAYLGYLLWWTYHLGKRNPAPASA